MTIAELIQLWQMLKQYEREWGEQGVLQSMIGFVEDTIRQEADGERVDITTVDIKKGLPPNNTNWEYILSQEQVDELVRQAAGLRELPSVREDVVEEATSLDSTIARHEV